MARIEKLIGEVADARLRAELASEVKRLKAQKTFGLVFEEHLPETVRLPNYPIRAGETVAERLASGNGLSIVQEVTRDDTWAKAKGLAQYAETHGDLFGRLVLAIISKGEIKRMDMNDIKVRAKARKFQSNNDVDALFS
jgi:hypothetical protein